MTTKSNEIDLEIVQLLPSGEGVARSNSKPIQVRNALPGEFVRARILKKRKGVKYSDAIEIRKASNNRKESPCQYFPRCGGCSMLHMTQTAELEVKQNKLLFDLNENSIVFEKVSEPIAKNILGYRRKARLGVKCLGDTVLVGFRESFSSRVARIDSCEILTYKLSSLIKGLKKVISQCSIKNHIPQIELAEGDDGVALIVRHLEDFSDSDILLWRDFSVETNSSVFFQSSGYDSMTLLDAQSSSSELSYALTDHGLNLKFYPEQFIQINAEMNVELIRTALCFFGDLEGKTIQDFFSGIGNFSLPMARRGAQVFGYELSNDSVDMAIQNAVDNELEQRTEFASVDLYRDLPTLKQSPDGILIDPPRSGAGEHLSKWLEADTCKKVVYVSCNSESFSRDAKTIVELGFKAKQIVLLNMFPGTSHFETVSLFVRD